MTQMYSESQGGLRMLLVYSKAFQFGQKSVDSIQFDFRCRIDFFDSIRQCDKFAACTLIFKY